MLHRNSNQGFRYMGNNRNGMDQSVPQGLGSPMMPLPFDGSGIAAAVDHRPGALSNTLASALASATPENQRLVCKSLYYAIAFEFNV